MPLELFSKISPTSLLADEVLPAVLTGAGTLTSVKPLSCCQSLEPMITCVRIASPYPQKSPKPCRTKSNASTSSDDGSTDSTSDMESTTSTLSELSDDSKIPKPPGEPGWPGQGGYTLGTVLGWNQKAFLKFKKYVHGLIDKHLDVTKCASAQNPGHLKLIKEKAEDKFPNLNNYMNCWPVNDLIMMH
ncbi:hypothetical protein J3R83DRAFT_3993 [Lanmaoa asiatica]|nr:hypothetical protein J3R83DRAFT_3993 [Lanmaoa asiatica]